MELYGIGTMVRKELGGRDLISIRDRVSKQRLNDQMFYCTGFNNNRIKLIGKQICYVISFLSFEWHNSEEN
jgi:hypothetical protein